MRTISIAGGHGQIALLLTSLLSARGDAVRGLVRDLGQSGDVEEAGGRAVELDLESASTERARDAIAGSDAVVFAAGAGPGSGAARKETVDYDGAVLLRDAAAAAGIDRYVMISAMGTDDPPDGDEVFAVYLRAKARADRAVMDSDLSWTIVRPGRLTDAPPTGRVALARRVPRGQVPRADVAAVVAAVLAAPASAGHVMEVVSGEAPIREALAALTSGRIDG